MKDSWRLVAALLLIGCTPFSADPDPGAADAADAGDGAPSPADAALDHRTGTITCYEPKGCNADQGESCCLVYQAGTPDYCFKAPAKCESDAARVGVVDCIDDSNCAAGKACCGIVENDLLAASQCRQACPAAGLHMCDVKVNPPTCPVGTSCGPSTVGAVYSECH